VSAVRSSSRSMGRCVSRSFSDFLHFVHQRPVDLLPERSTDSWAAWLTLHRTVEVVSRDRRHP